MSVAGERCVVVVGQSPLLSDCLVGTPSRQVACSWLFDSPLRNVISDWSWLIVIDQPSDGVATTSSCEPRQLAWTRPPVTSQMRQTREPSVVDDVGVSVGAVVGVAVAVGSGVDEDGSGVGFGVTDGDAGDGSGVGSGFGVADGDGLAVGAAVCCSSAAATSDSVSTRASGAPSSLPITVTAHEVTEPASTAVSAHTRTTRVLAARGAPRPLMTPPGRS